MITRDFSTRECPFGAMIRLRIDKCGIHVAQDDIVHGLRVRVEMVQQPNQHQLGAWLGFHPKLNCFATAEEIDQPDICRNDVCDDRPAYMIEPMCARLLRHARRQLRYKFGVGRRRPPDETTFNGHYKIGATGVSESAGT
jgi:hypothetical protein